MGTYNYFSYDPSVGVYKSTDDGNTWSLVHALVGISSMTSAPDGRIWVTQGNVLHKSPDHGTTWAVVGTFTPSGAIAWVGGNNLVWGQYTSPDENTWTLTLPTLPAKKVKSGGTGGCAYVTPSGVNYSNDHGVTWGASLFPSLSRTTIMDVFYSSPTSLGAIASYYDLPFPPPFKHQGFISVDSGATFTLSSTVSHGSSPIGAPSIASQVAVDPYAKILANTTGFTADGGANWSINTSSIDTMSCRITDGAFQISGNSTGIYLGNYPAYVLKSGINAADFCSTIAPVTLPPNGIQIKDGATVRTGAGDPEGVYNGNVGDLFLRTDGAAGTTTYEKTVGNGNSTGWVAVAPDDHKVLASSADTVAGYLAGLNPKLGVANASLRATLGGVIGVDEIFQFQLEDSFLSNAAIPWWDNTGKVLKSTPLSSDGTDITLDVAAVFYWGPKTADGSWRMRIDSGNFVVEKRESGVWNQKGAFIP